MTVDQQDRLCTPLHPLLKRVVVTDHTLLVDRECTDDARDHDEHCKSRVDARAYPNCHRRIFHRTSQFLGRMIDDTIMTTSCHSIKFNLYYR